MCHLCTAKAAQKQNLLINVLKTILRILKHEFNGKENIDVYTPI